MDSLLILKGGYMLLGLDVGGTFTDAVIIDAHRVVATAKRRTTKDNLMNGIGEALDAVLEGYDTSNIEQVTLSTTVVTNTIVEAKEQVVDLYVITGPGRNVDDISPWNLYIFKVIQIIEVSL